MRNLTVKLILLCSLGGGSLFAQDSSLLWKLSGNNINDSYLFGTIHLTCEKDLKLTESLKTILQSLDQLVLELDYDDASVMTEMQKYMNMEEATLGDLYSEEEFMELKAFFADNMGMPISPSDRMKPFILLTLMLPTLLECPPASYEISLAELAKNNQQEVIGLETVKEQMDAIDSYPKEDMADMLLHYIRNFDATKKDFERMIVVYNLQDPDVLLEEMNKQLEAFGSEQYNEILIGKRNRKWIDRIIALSQEKPSFFAFGAGHLGGPDGVINLLQEAGYTLTPLKL